jgi:hypothetical protein
MQQDHQQSRDETMSVVSSVPFSRQTSQMSAATMTTASTVSNPDNWDTYDGASDLGSDVHSMNHARLHYEKPRPGERQNPPRIASHGKRYMPDSGYDQPIGTHEKRTRALEQYGMDSVAIVDQRVVSNGSAWVDEETF